MGKNEMTTAAVFSGNKHAMTTLIARLGCRRHCCCCCPIPFLCSCFANARIEDVITKAVAVGLGRVDSSTIIPVYLFLKVLV